MLKAPFDRLRVRKKIVDRLILSLSKDANAWTMP